MTACKNFDPRVFSGLTSEPPEGHGVWQNSSWIYTIVSHTKCKLQSVYDQRVGLAYCRGSDSGLDSGGVAALQKCSSALRFVLALKPAH